METKLKLPDNMRIKVVSGEARDVNEEERSVVATITTDRVDSDKEIVLAAGVNMKRHDKNPVVLFSHDPTAIVGRAAWKKLSADKRAISAKIIFAPTDLGKEVFALVKGGFLRAWSIGMDPGTIKGREITERDVLKRTDWAGAQFIIEKSDLLEFSAVSIPANEDALNRAHDKGLIKHTKQYLPCGVVVTPCDEEDDPPTVIRVQAPIVREVMPVKVVAPTVRKVMFTADEAEEYVEQECRRIRGLT